MTLNKCFLYLALVVAFSMSQSSLSAQEESDIPSGNQMEYGKVIAGGDEVQITMIAPQEEVRTRTVTVQVPVQSEVEKDGEVIVVTKMETQERTEQYTVMVEKLMTQTVEPNSAIFQTISGTSVSFDQLGNYNDKPVLVLSPNSVITPYLKEVFNGDALVMIPRDLR